MPGKRCGGADDVSPLQRSSAERRVESANQHAVRGFARLSLFVLQHLQACAAREDNESLVSNASKAPHLLMLKYSSDSLVIMIMHANVYSERCICCSRNLQ
jgi:hypothetical protein